MAAGPGGAVRLGRDRPAARRRRLRGRSPGLGYELGFIPVDPHTLQAKVKPNVFALGDATDVLASKAGSVAHFEGEVLAGNVRRFLSGEPLRS